MARFASDRAAALANLARFAAATPSLPPDPPAVTVVTVTNRPDFLIDAIANFRRQAYPQAEWVVLVNAAAELFGAWQTACRELPGARVWHAPAATVGACRNRGVALARGDVVAMFDDDDLYGPHYLGEAVGALLATGAEMAGKLAYIWLDGREGIFRYRRPPGEWSESVATVSGNVQVFRRDAHDPAAGLLYADGSLAEDYVFSKAVTDAGGLIVSTGPRNFIRRRNLTPCHSHLWDGTAPGFCLTDHERLDLSLAEAERLAGIHG